MFIQNSIKEDELELWKSFLQGSDHCLEKLYRRYFDELFAYGKKWLNDTQITEDSIQDLFIKLLRSRKNLSTPVSVKFYLLKAFRSIVLDKIKIKNRFNLIDEPNEDLFQVGLSPEDGMIENEEAILIRKKLIKALEKLTPRQREAIYLKYSQGLSYANVSEMMELTPKATYKLMARAIDALKQQIPLYILVQLLHNKIV